MNYITQNIIEIYEERFSNDLPYLSEKLEVLKTHKSKYDGLNFLCCSADRTTIKMYAERTDLSVEDIAALRAMWHKI